MMRVSRFISLLLLCAAAAGCNAVTLVEPGKSAQLGNGVSVTPQTSWNQLAPRKGQTVWTQNGPAIDSVYFLTGIADGKPLYPVAGMRDADLGVFRDNMLPNDVQDLVVGTMQKEGFSNVRAGNLTPCPFGTATGFCFDLDFATQDGLVMKGKVQAHKNGATLDVFEFRAPSEYYYPALAPTVDKVFASAVAQ
jgi:hypothetical protein